MIKSSNLRILQRTLKKKYEITKNENFNYYIPSIWQKYNNKNFKSEIIKVHPYKFFLDSVNYILNHPHVKIQKTKHGEWIKSAVVYNLFVRVGCAFCHSQKEKIEIPYNIEGFRETGSFIKAITLLPYVKSLGTNTIYLLPITSIGSDGKKGSLGSPYAIKNPYKIDTNLSEPNVGVGADIEFKAFVESAHKLGMRVVVEFVFRTAAKDSDWVKKYPEWFYWIREEIEDRDAKSSDEFKFGPPIFTPQELEKIFRSITKQKFDNLIPPHKIYRDMFTKAPKSKNIHKENNRYIGTLNDGTRVRIPGAFADWPPNDTQPPWGDVTYLKLYEHPDFNYIGYNTVRMYDELLAKKEYINKPLWNKIKGIIPHYQHNFDIDGVMIDMGHALPVDLKQKIIRKARKINKDFAFWDENFSVSKKSLEEGYNAVIGYLWSDQHDVGRLKKILLNFSNERFPIPFFATPESHNTPRASIRKGGTEFSKYCWIMNNFIPAIPFIHNGFELGEKFPINTGLGFSSEDLLNYPSDRLPLFSEFAFDWISKDEFTDCVKHISFIRNLFKKLITNSNPKSFIFFPISNSDIIAFERKNKKRLLILANGNPTNSVKLNFNVGTRRRSLTDLVTGNVVNLVKGILNCELKPYQVLVLEL